MRMCIGISVPICWERQVPAQRESTGLVAGWGRGPPPVVPVVPVVPGETWLPAHKWPDILALDLS